MIRTKRITRIKEKCISSEGYEAINILSWHPTDTPYYELCPYVLLTDGKEEQYNEGKVIFENFWQASKVYPHVYSQKVYTHWTNKGNPKHLLWHYQTGSKGEAHLNDKDEIMPAYFRWRKSLFQCKKAIRYPNSFKGRHQVKFALLCKKDSSVERLDYIASRKRIYVQEYMRLVRELPIYQQLFQKVKNNQNICLFEIDVPAKNRRGEYGKYINPDGSYDCTLPRIKQLLEDPSEPFGHGLCLAMALLEDLEKTA